MARQAERHVSDFEAQKIAVIASAFATVRLPDKKLFAAFARDAE